MLSWNHGAAILRNRTSDVRQIFMSLARYWKRQSLACHKMAVLVNPR